MLQCSQCGRLNEHPATCNLGGEWQCWCGYWNQDFALNRKSKAQFYADKPLKPKAEQKACDLGLFSDDSKQTELF